MRGDFLPEWANVVRYIRATGVQDGVINGSEFCLRADRLDEHGLSVNWLEAFANLELDGQLMEIRHRSRIRFSKNGRLAQLNVGRTITFVTVESPVHYDLQFIEDPLEPEFDFPADPSHAQGIGLPAGDSPEAEALGDLIAVCVEMLYPARDNS